MSSSRGWVVMGATALAGGLGAAALARGRSTGAVKPAMDHQDAVSARNEDAARLLQHARVISGALDQRPQLHVVLLPVLIKLNSDARHLAHFTAKQATEARY